MTLTNDRYINLLTDFGFKKLFGEGANHELLTAILNELLSGKERLLGVEQLSDEVLDKRQRTYDFCCTHEKGEKVIVELQKPLQENFKDISLYNSSVLFRHLDQDRQYAKATVYIVVLLDFIYDTTDDNNFEHCLKFMDEHGKIFDSKITYIYLEIPKFDKALSELQNDYERWLYAFRNLHRLMEMPKELEQGVFKKLFKLAELAKMDKKERALYEEN